MSLPSVTLLAHPSDPFTSHMAAAKVDPCASHMMVITMLKYGPMTDEEIEIAVGWNRFSPSRLRTARKELMRMDPPKVRVCGTTKNSRNRTVQLFERV